MHTDIEKVDVNISVVLGQMIMPIHKLLRMGRGAVIELTSNETDVVYIHANGHPFALGQVIVTGSMIQVEITELLRRPKVLREPSAENPDPEPIAA